MKLMGLIRYICGSQGHKWQKITTAENHSFTPQHLMAPCRSQIQSPGQCTLARGVIPFIRATPRGLALNIKEAEDVR